MIGQLVVIVLGVLLLGVLLGAIFARTDRWGRPIRPKAGPLLVPPPTATELYEEVGLRRKHPGFSKVEWEALVQDVEKEIEAEIEAMDDDGQPPVPPSQNPTVPPPS
jgi:hypothetical protein